jgi:hypothetical protein
MRKMKIIFYESKFFFFFLPNSLKKSFHIALFIFERNYYFFFLFNSNMIFFMLFRRLNFKYFLKRGHIYSSINDIMHYIYVNMFSHEIDMAAALQMFFLLALIITINNVKKGQY